MRTRIPRAIRASIASSFVFAAALVYADPPVQVHPETFDFGEINQGETITARYQLHNTGPQPVVIQWLDLSEPGMVANLKQRIPPGSFNDVQIDWKTGKLLGDIEGHILVGLDDPENPTVSMTIRGTVVAVEEAPLDP